MVKRSISLINLRGSGRAATKLIEAMRDAIGILYEPTRMRRRAGAQADAEVLKEKGKLRVQGVRDRARVRVSRRELRRQQNLESILIGAVGYLPDEVDTGPVDEDWIAQFTAHAEDVSSETMQELWARLLAGEVTHPGTFSLRTLAVVSTLGQHEAILFADLCRYIWQLDGQLCHVYGGGATDLLDARGIGVEQLLRLEALGLLQGAGTTLDLSKIQAITVAYGDRQYRLVRQVATERTGIWFPGNIFLRNLTDVGAELFPLCTVEADNEYRDSVLKLLEQQGVEVKASEP